MDGTPLQASYWSTDESSSDLSVKHLQLLGNESASETSDDDSIGDVSCDTYGYKVKFCGSLILEDEPECDSDASSCGSSSLINNRMVEDFVIGHQSSSDFQNKLLSQANSFSSCLSASNNSTFFQTSQDGIKIWNTAYVCQSDTHNIDVYNSLLMSTCVMDLPHNERAAEATLWKLQEANSFRYTQLHKPMLETEMLKQKLEDQLEKMSELSIKFSCLQKEHETLKLEAECLRKESADIMEVVASLNSQFQSTSEENCKLNSIVAELEASIAERGREILKLEQVNMGLENQLHEASGACITEHISTMNGFAQEVLIEERSDEGESEDDNITQDFGQKKILQGRSEERMVQQVKATKTNKIDEGERTLYRLHIGKLERDLQALSNKVKFLNSSKSESDLFMSKLQMEKADLMKKLEESLNENLSDRERTDELVVQLQALTNTLDSQLSAKVSLERRASNLQREKDELEARIADMEEENAQLAGKVAELEMQIRCLKEQREKNDHLLILLQNNWDQVKEQPRFILDTSNKELESLRHSADSFRERVEKAEETSTQLLEELSALQVELFLKSDALHGEVMRIKHTAEALVHLQQENNSLSSFLQDELEQLKEQLSTSLEEKTVLLSQCSLLSTEKERLGASLHDMEQLMKAQEEKWYCSERILRFEMENMARELDRLKENHASIAETQQVKNVEEKCGTSFHNSDESTKVQDENTSLQVELSRSGSFNREAIHAKQTEEVVIKMHRNSFSTLPISQEEFQQLSEQLSISLDKNTVLNSHCSLLSPGKDRLVAVLHDMEELMKALEEKCLSSERRKRVVMENVTRVMNESTESLTSALEDQRLTKFTEILTQMQAESSSLQTELSLKSDALYLEVTRAKQAEKAVAYTKENISSFFSLQDKLLQLMKHLSGSLDEKVVLNPHHLVLLAEIEGVMTSLYEMEELIKTVKMEYSYLQIELSSMSDALHVQIIRAKQAEKIILSSLQKEIWQLTEQLSAKLDENTVLVSQCSLLLAEKEGLEALLHEIEDFIAAQEDKWMVNMVRELDELRDSQSLVFQSQAKTLQKINHVSLPSAETEIIKLMESLQHLEGELITKEKEISRLKEEFLQREADLEERIELLELSNEQLAAREVDDTGAEQLKHELVRLQNKSSCSAHREQELLSQLRTEKVLQEEIGRLQKENDDLTGCLEKFVKAAKNPFLIEKIGHLERELADILEGTRLYKAQLRSIFSMEENLELGSLDDLSDLERVVNHLFKYKQRATQLEEDIRYIQDQYMQASVQLAHAEAEKEEFFKYKQKTIQLEEDLRHMEEQYTQVRLRFAHAEAEKEELFEYKWKVPQLEKELRYMQEQYAEASYQFAQVDSKRGELLWYKQKAMQLEEDLRSMEGRYTQVSLQFAQAEAEKGELLIALKSSRSMIKA